MTLFISIFAVLIMLLCVWGFVTPKSMMKWVLEIWRRPSTIYFAIAIRIGLGILFLVVADQTRFPEIFRFLGYLMIAAAALIAMLGRKRLDVFVKWWVDGSPALARLWLVLGLIFGWFLLYAVN